MKGLNEQQLRERIAYIHGRIEREIEAFAASLALPAVALTSRLGALLLGLDERDAHRLPDVSMDARQGGRVLAEVESAGQSHGGVAQSRGQLTAGNGTGKAATNKVRRNYWANKTEEERIKEMARRRRKWTPEARAKWKSGGKPAKKKPKAKARKPHSIYNARAKAKKLGLPLPPLPSEQQAA